MMWYDIGNDKTQNSPVFPSRLAILPTSLRQRLWLKLAWICALYKYCSNNNDKNKNNNNRPNIVSYHMITGILITI